MAGETRWQDVPPEQKKPIIRGLFGVPEDHPEKLDIRGNRIHYKIRQQDGTFAQADIPNTLSNRQFVQWLQIHD